jgi:arylsulfatase A-like enzyme
MKSLNFSLALGLLVAMTASAASVTNTATKPNIIVILSDDVGWGDLGCYGATQIKTPNLDALAREGLRFTDAHASAAVCTPTRYSLLTGQYSWRRDAVGLNKGVANGDSLLLIPVGTTTLPGILKSAGYHTGAVGKWHLGFGNAKPDYNEDLAPGPIEIGFDEFFGYPATNDRMPPVFIRGHRVVNLDTNDPIRYSYNAAEAKKENLSRQAAGHQRIGWMSGGKAAWWKDTDIADTLTGEAVRFIERNHAEPFFLYFAPHDCHPLAFPHPRFAGTTGLSPRADMIHELDWSVGEIIKALNHLNLATNTLVIFSSDNGAYAVNEKGHRPNGPFQGKKSQLWEGGHREPFIARWPGHIAPGVSDELACLVDLPATAAAVVGSKLSAKAAPDSFNLLPVLLGQTNSHPRDNLVVMSGKGDLAIRQGAWKFIPDLAVANGWESGKINSEARLTGPGLYNLANDPGETNNLHAAQPAVSKRLNELLESARAAKSTRPPDF